MNQRNLDLLLLKKKLTFLYIKMIYKKLILIPKISNTWTVIVKYILNFDILNTEEKTIKQIERQLMWVLFPYKIKKTILLITIN